MSTCTNIKVSDNTLKVLEGEDFRAIPDPLVKAAFLCLLTSLVQEPFLGGDLKVILIHTTFNKLDKLPFKEEDLYEFKMGVAKIMNAFMVKNDFMG